VQLRALAWRHQGAHRAQHESQGPCRGEQPRGCQPVGREVGGPGIEAREQRRAAHRQPIAEDRARAREGRRGLARPPQRAGDRPAHRLRRQPGERRGPRGRGGEPRLGGGVEQRVQVEGVAASGVMQAAANASSDPAP